MSHTFFSFHYVRSRALFLVLLACLYLGMHGQMPKSSAGWVVPLHSPLQVAPARRLTIGQQRRLFRRRQRLNEFRTICRLRAEKIMQQSASKALLGTLFLAIAFVGLGFGQLLILSLVPLLVWVIRGLSWLRPQLIGQPEWRKLVWLLSCCEDMLFLMTGAVILFEFTSHFAHFAHGTQNEFLPQTYPLVLLLNSKNQHSEDVRLKIAHKMAALEAAQYLNPEASRRELATTLGIPESTLRYWEQRTDKIEAPEEVVAFFESPAGVLFLHRLVLAAQFTMGFVTPTGVRNICQFLELSGLSPFVASSYGSQRKMVLKMEEAIIDFGKEEEKRLTANMPQKDITLAEDETFKLGLCLVAIDPVSNFILQEKYSPDRSSQSWTAAINERLENMPVNVIQATSDQAKGIIHHVEEELSAHHSPDLFHILQELVRATARTLASRVQKADNELQQIKNQHQELTKKKQALLTICENELSLNSGASEFAKQLDQELLLLTEKKLMSEQKYKTTTQQAAEAKKLIQTISLEYHPYNLDTGHLRTSEELKNSLNQLFSQIKELAVVADLSDSAHRRIAKANRLIGKMVATQYFYFETIKAKVEALTLQEEVEQAVYNQLIPALYLDLVANRTKTANQRQEIRKKSELLLENLKRENSPIWQLSEDELEASLQVALECAQLFQRSSSCVEGRNGQLSLRHHSLHRMSNRKLNALTVIHNYWIKRADSTTAAERFFGSQPKELFEYLYQQVPLPPRPARKRQTQQPKNYLTLLTA